MVIILNRPEARNAISAAMIGELHNARTMLEQKPRMLLAAVDVLGPSTRFPSTRWGQGHGLCEAAKLRQGDPD